MSACIGELRLAIFDPLNRPHRLLRQYFRSVGNDGEVAKLPCLQYG
jgi:hypothetical protein